MFILLLRRGFQNTSSSVGTIHSVTIRCNESIFILLLRMRFQNTSSSVGTIHFVTTDFNPLQTNHWYFFFCWKRFWNRL